MANQLQRYKGPHLDDVVIGEFTFNFSFVLAVHVYKNGNYVLTLDYDMIKFIAKWDLEVKDDRPQCAQFFTNDTRIVIILGNERITIYEHKESYSSLVLDLAMLWQDQCDFISFHHFAQNLIKNYMLENGLTKPPNLMEFLEADVVDMISDV